MRKYLINLTFYAGDTDEENTDRKLVLVESDRNKYDIIRAIKKANHLCNLDADDEEEAKALGDFKANYYEHGINIDTLIYAIELLLDDAKILVIEPNSRKKLEIGTINAYFEYECMQGDD